MQQLLYIFAIFFLFLPDYLLPLVYGNLRSLLSLSFLHSSIPFSFQSHHTHAFYSHFLYFSSATPLPSLHLEPLLIMDQSSFVAFIHSFHPSLSSLSFPHLFPNLSCFLPPAKLMIIFWRLKVVNLSSVCHDTDKL